MRRRDRLVLALLAVLSGCAGARSGGEADDGSTVDSSDAQATDGDAPDAGKTFSFEYVSTWGKGGIGGERPENRGSGPGEFSYPQGIALSPDATEVYVVDSDNKRIVVMSSGGAYLREWPTPSPIGCMASGDGLAVGLDGTVYAVDRTRHVVVGYAPTGETRSSWTLNGRVSDCDGHALAVDEQGAVYVTASSLGQIQVFAPDGTFIRAIGDKGPGKGFLYGPLGVAVADGWVYATDGDRVLVFRDSGELDRAIVMAAGFSSVDTGIVAWHGWVFVLNDDEEPAILAQAPGATRMDYVWQTSRGVSPTQMRQPFALAIDAHGRFYVSELYNARVQVLDVVLPQL